MRCSNCGKKVAEVVCGRKAELAGRWGDGNKISERRSCPAMAMRCPGRSTSRRGSPPTIGAATYSDYLIGVAWGDSYVDRKAMAGALMCLVLAVGGGGGCGGGSSASNSPRATSLLKSRACLSRNAARRQVVPNRSCVVVAGLPIVGSTGCRRRSVRNHLRLLARTRQRAVQAPIKTGYQLRSLLHRLSSRIVRLYRGVTTWHEPSLPHCSSSG